MMTRLAFLLVALAFVVFLMAAIVVAFNSQVIDTGECWGLLTWKYPVISFCYAGQ